MKLKVLAVLGLFCMLAVCASAQTYQYPLYVGYPSQSGVGWTLHGNVNPLNCAGTCLETIPFSAGNLGVSGNDHKLGGTYEPQGANEELSLDSNGNGGWVSQSFTVPTGGGTYKAAWFVYGFQGAPVGGGNNVWPVALVDIDGSAVNLCRYPEENTITTTTSETINNPVSDSYHYIETCGISLLSGSHTIAFQQQGGHGYGGSIGVRQLVIYQSDSTHYVKGDAGCEDASGTWHSNAGVTGSDIHTMGTAAWNWAGNGSGTPCYNSGNPLYINLVSGVPGASGCGTNSCKVLEEM